jgi:phosphoribosylglycinamide formyltransferase-1
MAPIRLGVLGSGRGSNFVAIQDDILAGKLNAHIEVVLSDKPSPMLEKARGYGHKAIFVDPKTFNSKTDYDQELIRLLKEDNVDLVILAGYMRILSDVFIKAFPNRILNIHPSLLPLFKGLHPQRQALLAGVKESGCTVHYVTSELDGGPIVLQAVVSVLPDDTEATLAARILVQEHLLYSKAIAQIIDEKERVT